MRLLARDPASRFPTAADVRAALLGAGADDRVDRRRRHGAERPSRRRPRPPPPPGAARARLGRRPAPPADPAGRARPSGSRRASAAGWCRRCWSSLVAVALGVAGLLIGRRRRLLGDRTTDTPEPPPTARPPEPTSCVRHRRHGRLRPAGRRRGAQRRGRRTGNAVDGNPDTAWSTERYNTREFGELKDGRRAHRRAGRAGRPAALSFDHLAHVGLDGRRSTWPTPRPTSCEGWGEPVADDRQSDERHRRASSSSPATPARSCSGSPASARALRSSSEVTVSTERAGARGR